MKTLRIILVLLLVAAVGCLVLWWRQSPEASVATLTPAKISEIRSMVQLSTLNVYEEVPVKGHVGSRHMVARLTIEGDVAFDLEKLVTEMHSDTLVVILPPEIITLRESTAPSSYTVIDTWSDRPFRSGRFTTAEENRLKQLALEGAARRLYTSGCVKQARHDAVRSLAKLLKSITPGPVMVIDPTPEGNFR